VSPLPEVGERAAGAFADRLFRIAERRLGTHIMHDFLIALAFIGMVIAPAIVAANCSTEVTDESKSK
jgi:hypothetical protein